MWVTDTDLPLRWQLAVVVVIMAIVLAVVLIAEAAGSVFGPAAAIGVAVAGMALVRVPGVVADAVYDGGENA